jgi:hypothetical protein
MSTRKPVIQPVMSRRILACLLMVAGIAGCATERLATTAPSGVNLTGEWQLNPNLSDDPDKLGPDPDSTPAQHSPGGHRGHGGGRGGGSGMPPMGSPGGPGGYNNWGAYNNSGTRNGSGAADGPDAAVYLPVALTSGTSDQQPTPTPSRGMSINRLLKAPLRMSITQKDGTVVIKTNMPDGTQTVDEYTAGTTATIPFGPEQTAERTAGWRGPVFVVTTVAKKGPWREDDFALDEDGRLIVSTQTKGGRLGKLDIKRVYDRLRGAES